MDNVFDFRDELIRRYSSFSRSFVRIAAEDIRQEVERQYREGRYWPEPLIQINPNFQRKRTVQVLAAEGVLHPCCADLFQVGKPEGNPQPLQLYVRPPCAPSFRISMMEGREVESPRLRISPDKRALRRVSRILTTLPLSSVPDGFCAQAWAYCAAIAEIVEFAFHKPIFVFWRSRNFIIWRSTRSIIELFRPPIPQA
jgi:hypothetical protein